ncbi:MAG TPA: 2OG-Fe(II) oxygenase [Candidatus Sulfotelmatobacter sp.]|nr:2OG-Fe(II) oxygenase [Candidatus Sulfotelmatobacter sp.]
MNSEAGATEFLDCAALARTALATDPFPYVIVPGFLRAGTLARIHADFPRLDRAGSFPSTELTYGDSFGRLLAELEGPVLRAAIERKFAVDLAGRPTMITVRGQARRADGKIHSDSKSKLITVLLYLNAQWEAPGGRLRLLRSNRDLDDVAAEVPPDAGTLLAFKVTDNSWHGHEPFEGQRRAIQLNWVTDQDVVRREQSRHRFSARLKRLNPFARIA